MRGDFNSLRLAARQRRRRLAEPQVAEADFVEHLQAPEHLGRAAEEGQRLADGHGQYLIDAPAAVLHLEHLPLEALPLALVAWDEDVGEELHLDLDLPLPLARLTAAARHVE